MGVKVRLRPLELTTGIEWDCYPNATNYIVMEDNTIEIREKSSGNKYRVVAHVHRDRWDSVHIYETEAV